MNAAIALSKSPLKTTMVFFFALPVRVVSVGADCTLDDHGGSDALVGDDLFERVAGAVTEGLDILRKSRSRCCSA